MSDGVFIVDADKKSAFEAVLNQIPVPIPTPEKVESGLQYKFAEETLKLVNQAAKKVHIYNKANTRQRMPYGY